MGYKVQPSFDYAEFCVDYEKKTVNIKYPHKSSRILDFFYFFIYGSVIIIPIYLITRMIILSVFKVDIIMIPYLIILYSIWIVIAYKTDRIREKIIIIGKHEENTNQAIITGELKNKKIILKNVGNYFTDYETTEDYSKYLSKFEIKCNKCEIKKGKIFKQPIYIWEIHITFSQPPKKGMIQIKNEKGGYDETNNNNGIDISFTN